MRWASTRCARARRRRDLEALDAELTARRDDPRLVAVGEIGLDYFVEGLDGPKQERFFHTQLQLARKHGLPVLIHVRRSVDKVLKHLRQTAGGRPWQGIAHAFNGSEQQAQACIELGLKLGFGGAVTFERALQLRRLAGHAAARRDRDGDRRARHPAALALPHAGEREAGERRAATSPASCRASPKWWRNCGASASTNWPRPPPATRSRRCRSWKV
jgi:hypothetical protein